MASLPSRVAPNRDAIAAKVIDGEAILMNVRSGVYYSMEGVGVFVWEGIEQGASLEEVAERVARRYGVSREQAEADLAVLVSELLREEIVQEANPSAEGAAPSGPSEPGPTAGAPETYEAPELRSYHDMGDLLALDPPAPSVVDLRWRK